MPVGIGRRQTAILTETAVLQESVKGISAKHLNLCAAPVVRRVEAAVGAVLDCIAETVATAGILHAGIGKRQTAMMIETVVE